MSDVPLAQKYSAETYDQALSNLIERWKQDSDGGPIKYDEAAVKLDKSTVSVALKFLGEIGLLEVPKAGSYVVPDDVIEYRTKMGEVQREGKQDAADRLEDYALYREAKFMLGLDDFVLDDLAEDVSGSAAVAASKDELKDVKRSLNILAKLGFLEVDEEGFVSVPSDLGGDPEEAPSREESAVEPETSDPEPERTATAGDGGAAQTVGAVAPDPVPRRAASLNVDMDISMDVTEMEVEEVEEKLEVINDVLGQDEE